ncbi:Sec-independent protein translocase subunit TatA [Leifsonia sp. NPDC080035]|uniref:Sec-independent protein translocase protein TatA n=1 Tax=Leifsonia sp. NPDC080035 TaxID=3143936 RepID=A0AAU7G8Z7_9MICO
MFGGLTGWHLLIILAIILLLFGAPKLPALARSIGQSMRIFKGEVDEMKKDDDKDEKGAKDAGPSASSSAPAGSDSTESKPNS